MSAIFVCGRKKPRCSVPGCNDFAVGVCVYPLRGKAAGKTCGHHLCKAHALVQASGETFCRVHHEVSNGAVSS
jgi:hypothetical protein